MGAEKSVPQGFAAMQPWMTDDYVPMGGPRERNDGIPERDLVQPISSSTVVHNSRLLKTPFQALWSLAKPIGESPCSRTSHWSVFDENSRRLYIGYGLNSENKPLNDVWVYDLNLHKWAPLPLQGEEVTPRSSSRATLFQHYIVVFGGFANEQFIADFHLIDINTFTVSRPNTNGISPDGRSTPMVIATENKIIVWGGFNGQYPSELYYLDLSNLTWYSVEQDVHGRTGFPYAKIDNKVLIQGGSNTPGILSLDLETLKMTTITPLGTEPNSKTINSSIVKCGSLLVLLGGRDNSHFCFAFAYHTVRNTWFLFHIAPDGETVSTLDGYVTENGLFQIPRAISLSVVYLESERTIYGFLGAPHQDPPPIFRLTVDEALGFVNLQDDMLEALHYKM